MISRLAPLRHRRIITESRCGSHSTAAALSHGHHETEGAPATAAHYMSNTTETPGSNTKTPMNKLRLVLSACLGIPVLLLCSCAATPVKHYTLASEGAPRPAEEAIFRATEKPAMKPFVKLDGHAFSVGSELEGTVADGIIHPFTEPQMRSLEVRLLPGAHNSRWRLHITARGPSLSARAEVSALRRRPERPINCNSRSFSSMTCVLRAI